MKAARSFVSSELLGTSYPHLSTVSDECTVTADHQSARPDVGQVPQIVPMSDEEREVAAYRAGNAMQGWYSLYKEKGKPEYLDVAYHFLGLQKQLLAGRSPEYVAKLEAERGLGA